MIKSKLSFRYETRVETEVLGPYRIDLNCLMNLNQTIDSLFELLQKSGEESLLEGYSPYFGKLWPSARALSHELLSMPIRGKRLVELGCGLALPSLLAAKMGAKVTATDCHPDVPAFLEPNCSLNQIAVLQYIHLDWQLDWQLDWEKSAWSEGERFDWIVASDVLYEKQQPELLAALLTPQLKSGAQAILTDPGRPYLQTFADRMREMGFEPEISSRSVSDRNDQGEETQKPKEIFILRFLNS